MQFVSISGGIIKGDIFSQIRYPSLLVGNVKLKPVSRKGFTLNALIEYRNDKGIRILEMPTVVLPAADS